MSTSAAAAQLLTRLAPLYETVLKARYRYDWDRWARPNQIAPGLPGSFSKRKDWTTWLLLAGRGFGKNRCAAEWVRRIAESGTCRHGAFIGATWDDAVKYMVGGESGILAVSRPDFMPTWNANQHSITWPNGTIVHVYTAEKPNRLRGPNFDFGWADEIASWQYAEKTWSNFCFALRKGKDPKVVVSTTPRPTPLIKELLKDPNTEVARGTTYENRANLAPQFFAQIIRKYEGTRLGRQEINAEVLDDTPGALWTLGMIDASRILGRLATEMKRIVVGVDPAVSSNADSDETGIVTCGAGLCPCKDRHHPEMHGFVLGDDSGVYTPAEWARRVAQTYQEQDADRVVGEVNNGGDLVESNIRTLGDPNLSFRAVHASRGKTIRAEPIAAMFEQGKIHFVGSFPQLEDQLTTWSPLESPKSPDRLDACIARGTLILSEDGWIPIEKVRAGHKVWTRQGFRRVLAARLVQEMAAVMKISFSDGRNLVATPDHRVWREDGGWARLDALVCGDMLQTWNIPPQSPSKESSTGGTRMRESAHIACTTQHREEQAHRPSIEPYGSMRMARSLRACKSIMSMAIRSTTSWLISPYSHRRNMLGSMHPSSPMRGESGFSLSFPWRQPGTEVQKGEPGMPSMRANPGREESRANRYVPNVGSTTRLTSLVAAASEPTVPGSAGVVMQIGTMPMTGESHAQPVGRNSGRIGIEASPRPALVSVVQRAVAAGESDVFDLMVDGAHEFVASGVVVHNCVWALTDLLLESSAPPAYSAPPQIRILKRI